MGESYLNPPPSSALLPKLLRWRPGPATLLVISILVGCVAIFTSLNYAARAVDADSRQQEEALIANAIALSRDDIGRIASAVTLWDDSVARTDRTFDAEWTQHNLVEYLTQTQNYPLVFVLDAQDAMLLGRAEGADAAATLASLRPAADALFAEVRRREAARAPYPPGLPSRSIISKRIDASTIAVAGGATYMLTASLIQPDFGAALPRPRAPIVLAGRKVDGPFLQDLSRQYRVAPVRLDIEAPRPARGESPLAQIPLTDLQGVDQAWLSWAPKTPARQLQGTLFLPRLAAIIFVFTVPFVLILREQRHRRVLEAARRQAEAASEAKTEFLANMSHEFRTPLTVIIGFGRMLEVSQGLAEKERSMVSRINGASQTMLEMVNDVLDLARLESGEPDEVFEPIDARAIADSAVTLLTEQARSKGLYLKLESVAETGGDTAADAGVQPLVRAPAARLRQVLVNLIANALKFTSTGGVTVRLVTREDEVEIAVTDTGIGIAAAALDRIFERFAQAEASVNKRYGGTGLGLAISRRLVERMHGRLEVRSEVGRGSTFTVVLPRQ